MTELRIGIWLAVLGAAGALLYLLAPVLTPFLVSAILAYLGDPLVDRLERWRFSRTAAVTSVFVTLTLALLLTSLVLIPLLQQQVERLLATAPTLFDWLKHQLQPWLARTLDIDLGSLIDMDLLRARFKESLDTVGGLVATVVATVTRSGAALLGWFANLMLVPVVTFYLLRDWDVLVARVHALLPRAVEPAVARLAAEADTVLGAFLRGQFTVMLALSTIYAVGLAAIGLDLALLIGLLAGMVSFVPYLGFIVGIVVAGVAALVQFHDALHVLLAAAVFGVGQALEGSVLTPRLVGDRIGLHPVAVIFAVLAGGHLFGFFGVLLALPVAAVVMVLLRHTHDFYLGSELYDDRPAAPAAGEGDGTPR